MTTQATEQDSTNTAAQEEATKAPLFVSEKNGAKVNFYETAFQRQTDDSGKKGLNYPAPDYDESLDSLENLIQYVGKKAALSAILAKIRSDCQAVFEANCKPKIDSTTGNPIVDKDGDPMPDYEQFDIEGFQKDIVAATITSESKSDLMKRREDLMEKLVKVASDFSGKHGTPEQHRAAIMELKGEIELLKIQIEKKKRTRRTELPAESVGA